MKKIIALTLCICLLIPVLFAGFSHAKYVSTNTLSLNLTLGEESTGNTQITSGLTLAKGETVNSVIKELIPSWTYRVSLEIVFGTYKEYEKNLANRYNGKEEWGTQTWDNGIAVGYDGSDIRAFCTIETDWQYIYVYILTNDDSNNTSDTIMNMYWDSSKMFQDILGLKKITGLDRINTSNVKNMSYMFDGCYDLEEFDLSNFNTSGVTDMSHMFQDLRKLGGLDLSSFDTALVENMSAMRQKLLYLETNFKHLMLQI